MATTYPVIQTKNENVGVGILTPNQRLDVNGNIKFGTWTTAGSRYIGFGRNDDGSFGTAGASGMEIQSGNFGGAGNYDQKLHFWTHTYNGGSSRRLTIDNYGRVGIGQESPNYKLDVTGVINGTSDIRSQRLQLRSDALERWEGAGDDLGIAINYYGHDTTHSYFRDLNIFNGKGQYIAKFDGSSKHVGIGTTLPDRKLEVRHDTSGDVVLARFSNRVGTGSEGAYIGFSTGYSAEARIGAKREGAENDSSLIFSPMLNEATTEAMRIKSNGNVGINNTDPSYKLDVSGNARVTSSIATPNIYEATGGGGLALGNFTGNDSDEWPKIYWYRDTANGWDEGLIKGNSTRGVFSKSHYGIHFDDSRSFGFHTSGWDTEMEIRGDGHIYQKGPLYVGRTSQGVAAAHFSVQGSGWYTSDSQSRVLYLDGGSSNGNIIQFQRYGVNKWEVVGRDGTFYIYKNDGTGSGYRWQIDTNGNHTITGVVQTDTTFRAGGDVIAFYSSDKRLKDNISTIPNALDKINSIGGYEFDWNNNQDTYQGRDVGVLAQEIEEVLPEVVTTRDDGYKAVKYEKIIPLLIEGIKEQQKQIDELKALLNGSTK